VDVTSLIIGLGFGLCVGIIVGVGCGIATGISMEKKRIIRLLSEMIACKDIRVQDRDGGSLSGDQMLGRLGLSKNK
jgi:hypothetical protein